MDRGFYVSVSGMMSGSKKLNDISNNVANINTVGYKKDVSEIAEFAKIMITKLNDKNNIGYMSNQVYIDDTYTQFHDGLLVQTGVSTDYSITGEGFFKIEKDGQYVYTRDGSFVYDSEGYLVTSDGGYVVGKEGNRILYKDGVNQSQDILIVNFDNQKTLLKTDKGYWSNKFGLSNEYNYDNAVVKQGYLEMSNVDASEELTDLIKMQRYYQFNQRSLVTHDELLEKICQF